MNLLVWMKYVGLGCATLGLLAIVLGAVSCPRCWPARVWSSYIATLTRKVGGAGRGIAMGQLVAGLLLVVAELLIELPGSWAGLLLTAVAPPLVAIRTHRRRLARLEQQLAGFLVALANALRVTPNLSSALATLPDVMSSPLREEVALVIRELRVGSSLEEALSGLSDRVESRALDSALTAILIGQRLGGNLPQILDTTAAALRESARLESVLKGRTSEARAQLVVLLVCPFAMVGLLSAVSPDYFEPLCASALGWMILAVAISLWLAAVLLARSVLEVEL